MYCRECGAENESGTRYCAECGLPINIIQGSQEQNPLNDRQNSIIGKTYNFTRTIWFKFSRNVVVSFKKDALEIGAFGAQHIPYSSIRDFFETESVNIGEVAALVIGVLAGLICLFSGSPFLGIIGIVFGLLSLSHLKNTTILITADSGQYKIIMDSSDTDKGQFLSELRTMTGKG